MFQIQRILFPVDLSERSLGAGRYVQAMARHLKSAVTLLHLVELATHDSSVLDKIAVRKVEIEMFLAAEFRPFLVKRLVLEGDPRLKIGEVADSEKAGLIMMPTHGWGVDRRFILGSVTAQVLQQSACPVWTCGHAEQAPPSDDIYCRSILCAVDLGPQSHRVLEFAGEFAATHRARLTVLYVSGGDRPLGTGYPLIIPPAIAEVQLSCLSEQMGLSCAKTMVISGEVSIAVQRAAQEIGADLVIMGRSSGNAIMGRLRSTAYSIIRESPRPVISV